MLNRKIVLLLNFLPLFALAQVQTLKDSAQDAVLTNPEVQLKWHTFEAANGERDVAAGGYLPKVDVQAGSAFEMHNDPLLKNNYNSHSQSITLTQMLYDGFATSNDVDRLDHNRLVRLYELYDVTETTTLEVVRAHFDVLRYRKLVALAEENYVQHRALYNQLQSKAKAGVGRRVDLEQSAGRLAVAEANLLTETSNLHDVSARFQRLVGKRPAKLMDEPTGLNAGLPAELGSAIRISNSSNPAILAAIENIRATNSESHGRRSAFQPRVDVRLNGQHGTNINSEVGESNDKTAQVVLSWNLFNGFSDRAKLHQLADQINATRDYRDKVCRDLRQNLEISYNDNHKIIELLGYLDQHQLSIEKARDAYRQQFNIGQRTLLDLLDTENELFQARRSYVEAQYDQQITYARMQAGMGNLFKALGLTRPDAGSLPKFDNDEEGQAGNCPVEAPETYVTNKEELDLRAVNLLKDAAPVANSATTPAEPGLTAVVTPTTESLTPVAGNINRQTEQALVMAVNLWRQSWVARDIPAYLHCYADFFRPNHDTSHDNWVKWRKQRISEKKLITLAVENIHAELKDATHAVTRFHQIYHSDIYNDVVEKTLEWEKVNGIWLITSETPEPR